LICVFADDVEDVESGDALFGPVICVFFYVVFWRVVGVDVDYIGTDLRSAGWRLRRVGVARGGELDLGGDFGPAAVAVDAAVGAHGAENRVAGEGYVVDGFDEGVEGGVQTFAALEEKAGGAGVAVDGAIVAELVVVSEPRGGAPVDEFLFDGFAFGVVADDAATAVAFENEDLQLFLQPALTVDAIGFSFATSFRWFLGCWFSGWWPSWLFSRSSWVVLL
jgi:hypothetical protein